LYTDHNTSFDTKEAIKTKDSLINILSEHMSSTNALYSKSLFKSKYIVRIDDHILISGKGKIYIFNLLSKERFKLDTHEEPYSSIEDPVKILSKFIELNY
ncbi:MAG: hypothetical protein AB2531_13960, partial [Candidatus Thiodiazotropha sp.]